MRKLLFLFLLTSCTSGIPWKVDSIIAGNASFDSSRLSYKSPSSPLHLEFIRYDEEILCYLSLNQFRFHPSVTNPPRINVQFTLEEENFEESLPLDLGQMRLRLPPSTTSLLLSSLQEGKKVVILIDGFEETLLPENFQKIYEEWKGKPSFLRALLKGPL